MDPVAGARLRCRGRWRGGQVSPLFPILLLAPKRFMRIGSVTAFQMVEEIGEEGAGIMRLLRIQGHRLEGWGFGAFQQILEGADPVPHPGVGPVEGIPTLIKNKCRVHRGSS